MEGKDSPTVPQPRAVPQPIIVLKVEVMTGLPAAPVGVIVSMLIVDIVLVTGSKAVKVSVIVIVSPSPGFPPGAGIVVMKPGSVTGVVVVKPGRVMTPDVLSTPVVMTAVLFAVLLTPGG